MDKDIDIETEKLPDGIGVRILRKGTLLCKGKFKGDGYTIDESNHPDCGKMFKELKGNQ